MRLIFERLRENIFTISGEKCKFLVPFLKVLFSALRDTGIAVDEDKIIAITQFLVPRTQRDARSFVSLCSYYRKHIFNCAKIGITLTKLYSGIPVKRTTKIKWKTEHQDAFDFLEFKMSTAPVLAWFDLRLETQLRTDASQTCVGAILLQKHSEGAVAHAFRKLNILKTI